MRFLADHDVYEATARRLEAWGHDVLRARQAGLCRARDADLLRFACEAGRVLVTRDKGFGQLVFLSMQPHSGVILLRMDPTTVEGVHRELGRFLMEQIGEELKGKFVVVEPSGHRIRTSS